MHPYIYSRHRIGRTPTNTTTKEARVRSEPAMIYHRREGWFSKDELAEVCQHTLKFGRPIREYSVCGDYNLPYDGVVLGWFRCRGKPAWAACYPIEVNRHGHIVVFTATLHTTRSAAERARAAGAAKTIRTDIIYEQFQNDPVYRRAA